MPDGRKSNGGARANAGRKPKQQEIGIADLLKKCWSDAEREKCFKKLVTDCNARDFKQRQESRKLLFAYAFGKPKETRETINFDFDKDDLLLLNDYELERIRMGDDPRPIFAAARLRAIRAKAEAGTEED